MEGENYSEATKYKKGVGTCYLPVKNVYDDVYQLFIKYKGEKIKEVHDVSFLGVTVDRFCNWKAHGF